MAVATRGIEREISSLQMEEKKLVAEIKKTAKTGNEVRSKATMQEASAAQKEKKCTSARNNFAARNRPKREVSSKFFPAFLLNKKNN
nr:PREDICTED: uncharacterized protein LOC104217443 isoform X2 [Nicotiana sylvestris]